MLSFSYPQWIRRKLFSSELKKFSVAVFLVCEQSGKCGNVKLKED
ncbi:Hypothetical protein CpOVID04_1330 [Corynebacterium pseudotuberculosis]|nr:Hypothetical protein CpOVID04_1330 [Corynebacterium pseudotuberculosis]